MEQFEKNEDGTVTDTKNGLIWSKTLAEDVTFSEAEKAVAELGEGWRLPTIDELQLIVDRSTHTLTRQRVVTHFKEALSAWERDHVTNELIKATPESLRNIKSVIASYMGHIKQASSQRLIRKIVQRHPWINAVMVNRKFDYRLEGNLLEIRIGETK